MTDDDKMPLTDDQIIAEAERLALAEWRATYGRTPFPRLVARHALRLAAQPKQDPQLVKAMDLADELFWNATGQKCDAVARMAPIIMSHYPGPDAEAVQWARFENSGNPLVMGSVSHQAAADYILKMAGETA